MYKSRLFKIKHLLTILLVIWAIHHRTMAQLLNVKSFSEEPLIAQKYVYSIVQDQNGIIYFGTSEGLIKFDSKKFNTVNTTKNLKNSFIISAFVAKDNKLWCGDYQNGIFYLDKGNVVSIANNQFENTPITSICEGNSDVIYFAAKNKGIYKYSQKTKTIQKIISSTESVSSLKYNENNNALLVLSNNRLRLYNPKKKTISDSLTIQSELSDFCEMSENTYLIAGRNGDLFKVQIKADKLIYTQITIQNKSQDFDLINKIHFVNNTLYATSNQNGLFKLTTIQADANKLECTKISIQNGLNTNYLLSVFVDYENNLWVGTSGYGINFIKDEKFTLYGTNSLGNNKNIQSLFFDKRDILWIGTSNSLTQFDIKNNKIIKIYNQKNGLVTDEITSILIDRDTTIWVGTANSGFYKKTKNEINFRHIIKNNLINTCHINKIIEGINNEILFATTEGLIAIDKNNNDLKITTTEEGLAHNNLTDILIDSRKRLWLISHGTPPTSYQNGSYTIYKDIQGNASAKFNSIVEDQTGAIWFATEGDGLFKFNGSDFRHYSSDDGLLSNYCYSVFVDSKNTIWVGHKNGVSAKENNIRDFTSFTKENGFMSIQNNKNCIISYLNNSILFGTKDGIVKFLGNEKRLNIKLPQPAITKIQIDGKTINQYEDYKIDYSKHNLKIEFISPYFTDPEQVKYRYMLKGLDNTWTYTSSAVQQVNYNGLIDGTYYLMVQSTNDNIFWSPVQKTVKITILKPIWKYWWPYFLLTLILTFIVWQVFVIKTKKILKAKLELEKRVEQKTRTIVEKNIELEYQKSEIDKINFQLTESINYSQKIQESILSSTSIFGERAKNIFVYFKPRNIIGGDFYWFYKHKNNGDKYFIVAADCTGHGVPGAMLSMMGSILLSKIADYDTELNPSQLLFKLDLNVKNVLNQDSESKSIDGMDAAICSIDFANLELDYAGAYRPIIIIRGSEIIELEPSKFTIGLYHAGEIKTFKNQTFQLQKNDMIYLFSDGYSDQFGGVSKKRFMKKRLLELLRDISTSDINEQKEIINNKFVEWQGSNKQVDDVLLLGIRI